MQATSPLGDCGVPPTSTSMVIDTQRVLARDGRRGAAQPARSRRPCTITASFTSCSRGSVGGTRSGGDDDERDRLFCEGHDRAEGSGLL